MARDCIVTLPDINSATAKNAHRDGKFGGRISLSILALSALAILAVIFTNPVSAQRRTPRRPPTPAKPAIDYSKFSHATDKHRGACVSCHKVPTKDWQKVRKFPDVADFPDHDACVSCHRRQFFRGASPPICTVCHLRSSPRDDKRFAFRNPVALQQFAIEFPHDKHQDVIAKLVKPNPISVAIFRRVAFSFSDPLPDEPGKLYNNCTICHAPLEATPPKPSAGWVDSFVPDPATFKSMPRDHASCFNCHWKSQPPVRTECNGCHKLDTPHLAAAEFRRISMKFRHAREQHIAECATCHINITKSATLRGLTPDVPITSCTECHNKDGLRQDVTKELESIDRKRDFVCVYCHTSDVGRRDPPASHYLISGRDPMKRTDNK
ncbi:MAG TPA: cytochrome c3 family protein [Pyrinomonadaceae bacterium]|nr:cytochrome c3 family protein [Pyrinomonadaceae bacterium]